ncbi:MAG: outer membrane lipoprotein carrier protein LolA [Paludibacteraceae bacterium]|jgi:outer membrane lipoprotein-sorting protein|nr:outer membrane lipoprotein carrier protein LolA [Paludibacteraceae bacterium]
MKKLGIITLFCWFATLLFAEVNPEAIALLNKTSDIYKQSTGTEISLNINIDDAQSGQQQSVKGTLKTRDKRFVLTTQFATMNFDGTNLYIYQPDVNEITISSPSDAEVQDMDPTQIMSNYNQGFQIPKPEYKTENGKNIAIINLYPEDKSEDYHRLSLKVDTATNKPLQIATYGKNGMTNTIDILKIETNKNFSEKDLIFDLKKYPKAQVIDIR